MHPIVDGSPKVWAKPEAQLEDFNAARTCIDVEFITTAANFSSQVSLRHLSLDRNGMFDRNSAGAAFCIQPERRIIRQIDAYGPGARIDPPVTGLRTLNGDSTTACFRPQ